MPCHNRDIFGHLFWGRFMEGRFAFFVFRKNMKCFPPPLYFTKEKEKKKEFCRSNQKAVGISQSKDLGKANTARGFLATARGDFTPIKHMWQSPTMGGDGKRPTSSVVLSPSLPLAFYFDCVAGVHFNMLVLLFCFVGFGFFFFILPSLQCLTAEERDTSERQIHFASITKRHISKRRKIAC